jgi:hypothetical protein
LSLVRLTFVKWDFVRGIFLGSVFCFAVRMKWFDKLFGSSGSSHDYDGEGYYYGHPPPYNSGGWNGPDFFSDPRRRDEGTSYGNDWPFYPNDRPYYSHERPPYPSDTQSHEELDRAIALSLAEDHS